jgi:hypothetical protein
MRPLGGYSPNTFMNRRTYYDLIRERIGRAAAEAALAAKTMDHSALAGSIREIALRNCVEPYLTHSFRCGSGKIVDTTGYLTKQIDLIVYQTKLAPPLMVSKEVGIFPAECCAYAFEVKSTLNATEIKSALEVANSVKTLRRFPKSDGTGALSYQQSGPATILFAFGSDISGHELGRYLKYDLDKNPAFTGLLVLGKGYWYWTQDKGWFGATVEDFSEEQAIFALFIAGFTNTLASQEATIRAFVPGNYMLPDQIEAKPFKKSD